MNITFNVNDFFKDIEQSHAFLQDLCLYFFIPSIVILLLVLPLVWLLYKMFFVNITDNVEKEIKSEKTLEK